VAAQRQRRAGRTVLLTAALAAALTGVAACGNGGDTQQTGALATESPSTAVSESTTAAPAETATEAATPAPIAEATAPIVVTAPAEGSTVNRTFTVTGKSRTAEGTIVWALVRGDEVVANDAAQGGSDGAAPFRFTVTAPAAGTYTLRVFEESAKDGQAKNEVTRTLTVR
jgi:hypothetical protein